MPTSVLILCVLLWPISSRRETSSAPGWRSPASPPGPGPGGGRQDQTSRGVMERPDQVCQPLPSSSPESFLSSALGAAASSSAGFGSVAPDGSAGGSGALGCGGDQPPGPHVELGGAA